MKSFIKNGNLTSGILQSKIKTISSIDQSRVTYYPQSFGCNQEIQENIGEWLKKVSSSPSQLKKSFSHKYFKFDKKYDFYSINIHKIDNINLGLISFQYKSQSKLSTPKLYVQLVGTIINQSNQCLSGIWKSQLLPLQVNSKNKAKIQQQEIVLYLYIEKTSNEFLKLDLNILISQQIQMTEAIIDSKFYGYTLIDLNEYRSKNCFQIFHDFQNQSHHIQQINQQNYQQKKQGNFSTIQCKIIQSAHLKNLTNLIQCNQVYDTHASIPGLRSQKLPLNLQDLKDTQASFLKLQTINIQLSNIMISETLIRNAFQNYKQCTFFNIQSYRNNLKSYDNYQFSVKEYRLFFICHNGLTICDSSSIQLKQNKNQEKEKDRDLKSKEKNFTKNSNKQKQHQVKQAKKQQKNLTTDQIVKLSNFTNDYGVVFIVQLNAKVQLKIESSQYKNKAFTMNLPLGFLIKPGQKLQNDIKYSDKLIQGEALSQKGIQNWLIQKQKKQLKQSTLMHNQSQFLSLSKVKQKSESITQSTIQFYVCKQFATKKMPISRIVQRSQYLQRSNVSIKAHQSDLMYSHSFLPQNEIKKIMMQKSRVMRQTKKLKEIIHKKNIQQNKTIPLLDPSDIKKQIYLQKIQKIRQQKQKVRQMHHFLKSKLDQFTQSIKQQDFIVDVLTNIQGGPKISKLPRNFINAKSKLQTNLKQQPIITSLYRRLTHQFINLFISFQMADLDVYLRGIAVNYKIEIILNFGIQDIQRIVTQWQIKSQFDKILIQHKEYYPNPVQISSLLTLVNVRLIIKVMELIKSNKSIEMSVQSIDINSTKQINIFTSHSGFQLISNKAIKLPYMRNRLQQQNDQKLSLSLQNCNQNLLITVLSSYISIYLLDVSTNFIIGQTYLNLKNFFLSIINKTQQNEQLLSIYSYSKIIGSLKFKLSLNDSKKMKAFNKSQQLYLTRQILQQKIQNQQFRKLQRIRRFKKEKQQNQLQLKNRKQTQNQNQAKVQSLIQGSTKSAILINYHSLNNHFFQIQVQNKQEDAKQYIISINDEDKQFYDILGDYDQLIIVTNQKYRQQIKMSQQLSQRQNYINQINWIKPDEKGYFTLQKNEKGIVLFSYLSERKYFPIEFLNQIDGKALSVCQQQLNYFNRPHSITLIFSSENKIEHLHIVKIQPQQDSNTTFYSQFVDHTQPFEADIKIKNLQNIYFDNQNYQLLEDRQKLVLKGKQIKLHQFQIINFMIYQPSYCLVKKILKSSKFVKQQTQVLKAIISQKFLNNYIIVYGTQKLQAQCRLFETLDTMFTLKTQNIETTQRQQKQYLVLSQDQAKVGFKNKNGLISSNKKIIINHKTPTYFIKFTVQSQSIGLSGTKIILKDQQCLKTANRIIFNIRTISPTIHSVILLEVQDWKIDQEVEINASIDYVCESNNYQQTLSKIKVKTTYPQLIWSKSQNLRFNQNNSSTKRKETKLNLVLNLKLHLIKQICKGNICNMKNIILGLIQEDKILYYQILLKKKQSRLNIDFGINILTSSQNKKNAQKKQVENNG